MIALLLPYAARLVGERWAKAAVYIALALICAGALLLVKTCYDSALIDRHDAVQSAEIERRAREAQGEADATYQRQAEADAALYREMRKDVENVPTDDSVGNRTAVVLDRLRAEQARGNPSAR